MADKNDGYDPELEALLADFEMDDDTESIPDNRSPVVKSTGDFTKGFSDTVKNDKAKMINKFVSGAIPKELSKEVDIATTMKNKFADELKESGELIKREAKPLLKSIEKYVPDSGFGRSVFNKVKGIVGEDSGNSGPSREDMASETALGEIKSLLGEKKDSDNLKELLKNNIEHNRAKGQAELLSIIATNAQNSTTFRHEVQDSFYRKQLAIGFKTTFLLKETLEVQKTAFSGFKIQLDAMTKNTGLPDFAKINPAELVQARLKQRFMDKKLDPLFKDQGWAENTTKKWTNNIKNVGRGVADGMGMTNDMLEMSAMSSEMGMSAGGMAGDMAAGQSSKFLGGFLGKHLSKERQKQIFDIKTAFLDPKEYFKKKQENSKGGMSKAFGAGSSFFDNKVETADVKVFNKDPNDPAYYSNRTDNTINTVIPSLLAKNIQAIYSLKGINAPLLSYDSDKQMLTTKDEIKQGFDSKIKQQFAKSEASVKIESILHFFIGKTTPAVKAQIKESIVKFIFSGKPTNPDTLISNGLLEYIPKHLRNTVKTKLGRNLNTDNPETDYLNKVAIKTSLDAIRKNIPNPQAMIDEFSESGNIDILVDEGLVKYDKETNNYQYNKEAYVNKVSGIYKQDIGKEYYDKVNKDKLKDIQEQKDTSNKTKAFAESLRKKVKEQKDKIFEKGKQGFNEATTVHPDGSFTFSTTGNPLSNNRTDMFNKGMSSYSNLKDNVSKKFKEQEETIKNSGFSSFDDMKKTTEELKDKAKGYDYKAKAKEVKDIAEGLKDRAKGYDYKGNARNAFNSAHSYASNATVDGVSSDLNNLFDKANQRATSEFNNLKDKATNSKAYGKYRDINFKDFKIENASAEAKKAYGDIKKTVNDLTIDDVELYVDGKAGNLNSIIKKYSGVLPTDVILKEVNKKYSKIKNKSSKEFTSLKGNFDKTKMGKEFNNRKSKFTMPKFFNPFDRDGSGRRDGSWQDIIDKRNKKKPELGENKSATSKLKNATGSVFGLLSSMGGSIVTLLSGLAGGLIPSIASMAGSLTGMIPGLLMKLLGSFGTVAGLLGKGLGLGGKAGKGMFNMAKNKLFNKGADVKSAKASKSFLSTMFNSVKKLGGKSLLKKIPVIGSVAALGYAAKALYDGDFVGVGAEVASAGASMIPGLGTAAAVGIDAWNANRKDKNRDHIDSNDDEISETADDNNEREGKAVSIMTTASNNTSYSGKLKIATGEYANPGSMNDVLQLGSGVRSLRGMNKAFKYNLLSMANEYKQLTGKKLPINSAYRDPEKQRKLYDASIRAGKKGSVAPPGRSLHNYGLAADLNTKTLNQLDEMGLLRKYGFTRPVGKETWHMEAIGTGLDIDGSKKDPSYASSLIMKSLGKGGSGWGVTTSAGKYSRNVGFQESIISASDELVGDGEKAKNQISILNNRKSINEGKQPNTRVNPDLNSLAEMTNKATNKLGGRVQSVASTEELDRYTTVKQTQLAGNSSKSLTSIDNTLKSLLENSTQALGILTAILESQGKPVMIQPSDKSLIVENSKQEQINKPLTNETVPHFKEQYQNNGINLERKKYIS